MPLVITQRKNGSLRVQKACIGESLTEQSHRPGQNINGIVARARKGIMPELQTKGLTFGDFSGEVEFLDIQVRMAKAKSEFMMLQSSVRSRFQNSPARLCAFLADPENREEAIALGLIPEKDEAASGTEGKTVEPEAETGDPTNESEVGAGQ